MTAVTISGTFSKDERPQNGLEEISADLLKDQFARHVVVGVVQFAGANVPGPGEPTIPRVKFVAIEPLTDDAADQARQILDQARKQRGLDLVAQTLFDDPAGSDDEDDGVPPPSGEELTAELDERRAARRKREKPATDPFKPAEGDDA